MKYIFFACRFFHTTYHEISGRRPSHESKENNRLMPLGTDLGKTRSQLTSFCRR